MWSSSSSIAALRLVFGFAGPSCLAGSVMEYRHGPAAAAAAAAANRHCLELYTRVYKSRHPSSLLSSPLAVRGSLLHSSSYAARPPCAPCLLLRSLLSSHLDPSFNRLCRICLAPLTFPQNPPACHPARCPHSLGPVWCTRRGRRLTVIPRFHFSKSRYIELRVRASLRLSASVLRPVRLGGDRERRRLQDVIPADARGGGGGSRKPRQRE